MMATDLADYLVRKQVTFRESHGAVGRLVREAEEAGVEMDQLPLSSFTAAHAAFGPDVLEELKATTSLRHRDIPGGTGPNAVAAQLAAARAAVEG
jgi:argininosuccinate lyase